ARDGWHTREGFALPESSWDVAGQQLLLYGRVADLDTAALAVLAAARDAGVVAIADTGVEAGRALLADLARIGPVSREAGAGVEDAVGGPLGVPGDAADQSGQVDRRTEVDPYGRAAPQRRQHGGDHQPR